MRKHKFRAWDKKREKWISVNLHMSVTDGTLWWQLGYGCEPLSAEETENIELAPYIGLRDIHCKEVYFGDIVKDIEGWTGIIKWDKKGCFIYVDYPFNKDSMMIEDAFGPEPDKNIEIITNIYEDPEFFEEAKKRAKKLYQGEERMIEIWKCNNCGFEAIDMAFYIPRSEVKICPKCHSDDIVVGEQGWVGAPNPDGIKRKG